MIFYQIPFSFVPYRVSMKWQLTGENASVISLWRCGCRFSLEFRLLWLRLKYWPTVTQHWNLEIVCLRQRMCYPCHYRCTLVDAPRIDREPFITNRNSARVIWKMQQRLTLMLRVDGIFPTNMFDLYMRTVTSEPSCE